MRPSSITTSATASKPEAGSMMRPFLMSSLAFAVSVANNPFEHRHAHGDAVLHLVQNHGALAVGDLATTARGRG